jgi:hypothetical protein
MHWEVWALDSGNLIDTPATEAEALRLVRELLDNGWRAEDLALALEDESRPVGELPPTLSGVELAARAQAAGPNRAAAPSR